LSKEKSETSSNGIAPTILALDTSSKLTSLAIAKGRRLIANFGGELDDKRSARLWELTDFLLSIVGLRIEDVDVFSVCTGPGGFTGLRVGMATVQGFAVALGKPAIGVTSLEALAALAYPATSVYVLSNAYKGEVYAQRFSFDEAGLPKALSTPIVGDLQKVLEMVAEVPELIFTGDGAETYSDGILQFHQEKPGVEGKEPYAKPAWRIMTGTGFLAETIAQLAYGKFLGGQAVNPSELEACYVRSADVKIQKQV
jgi:tRNA threonylcarbamoyladenosine biosynthesis protein TsaB